MYSRVALSPPLSLCVVYNPQCVCMLQGQTNHKGVPLEASFSPDSQFVFSGKSYTHCIHQCVHCMECVHCLFASVIINCVHYLSVGATDGKVHCWNTETGAKVGILNGDHSGPVTCVQFNPKYMMLATGCTNMVCFLSYLLNQSTYLTISLTTKVQ